MEVKVGVVRRWLDSHFNFKIKHVQNLRNIPPDALLQRLDMPEATTSEFQAGAEYKPWYMLDPALFKAQALTVGQSQAPVTTDLPCNLDTCCEPCRVYITKHHLAEPAYTKPVEGLIVPLLQPAPSPFVHRPGDHALTAPRKVVPHPKAMDWLC